MVESQETDLYYNMFGLNDGLSVGADYGPIGGAVDGCVVGGWDLGRGGDIDPEPNYETEKHPACSLRKRCELNR